MYIILFILLSGCKYFTSEGTHVDAGISFLLSVSVYDNDNDQPLKNYDIHFIDLGINPTIKKQREVRSIIDDTPSFQLMCSFTYMFGYIKEQIDTSKKDEFVIEIQKFGFLPRKIHIALTELKKIHAYNPHIESTGPFYFVNLGKITLIKDNAINIIQPNKDNNQFQQCTEYTLEWQFNSLPIVPDATE